MLIRIFHFFINSSIRIIMDWCYNKNPTSSWIVSKGLRMIHQDHNGLILQLESNNFMGWLVRFKNEFKSCGVCIHAKDDFLIIQIPDIMQIL